MISSPRSRLWLAFAGLNGAVAVAAEAFARHGLDPLADAHAVELIGVASRYQGFHALALVVVVLLADRVSGRLAHGAVLAAGWAFVIGLVLFCGGLYGIVAGAPASLTAVVPAGGTAFIVGWLALAGLAGSR
jgi:uncharacterized membrane protein YgdD (TMEM256/DUF423 family)